jgi:hypothetical protein
MYSWSDISSCKWKVKAEFREGVSYIILLSILLLDHDIIIFDKQQGPGVIFIDFLLKSPGKRKKGYCLLVYRYRIT